MDNIVFCLYVVVFFVLFTSAYSFALAKKKFFDIDMSDSMDHFFVVTLLAIACLIWPVTVLFITARFLAKKISGLIKEKGWFGC